MKNWNKKKHHRPCRNLLHKQACNFFLFIICCFLNLYLNKFSFNFLIKFWWFRYQYSDIGKRFDSVSLTEVTSVDGKKSVDFYKTFEFNDSTSVPCSLTKSSLRGFPILNHVDKKQIFLFSNDETRQFLSTVRSVDGKLYRSDFNETLFASLDASVSTEAATKLDTVGSSESIFSLTAMREEERGFHTDPTRNLCSSSSEGPQTENFTQSVAQASLYNDMDPKQEQIDVSDTESVASKDETICKSSKYRAHTREHDVPPSILYIASGPGLHKGEYILT